MSNPLLDLLGDVGYAADTPGAYLRGALSGRLGERAAGEDMLNSWGLDGGPLGGMAAEMVLDPLMLAGLAGGAYKGIQGVTRAGRALGHADDAGPLARAVGRFVGDETGALVPGFAPFHPDDIASATGVRASQIGNDVASEAYRPWAQGLSPEEASAIKLYTGSPQARISHAMRGSTTTAGGFSMDPFADESHASLIPGSPPIDTPGDVMSEVVPYLDSALSRGSAPGDMMTYRLAQRIGGLTPETAESMIGQTVSDPSYLSTTINPWDRFYGNNASPKDMILDMMVPHGGSGGYADSLSNWAKEKELILPRDAQFRVADARGVPVQKIDYDWYRLDPEGKPFPRANQYGKGMFRDVPDDEMADFLRRGTYGDAVVPRDFMSPDWKRYRDVHLKGEGTQVNALLQMLPGGLPPHTPSVRRLTPEEVWAQLSGPISSQPARSPFRRSLRYGVEGGEYPDYHLLQQLSAATGGSYTDLLRSIPR